MNSRNQNSPDKDCFFSSFDEVRAISKLSTWDWRKRGHFTQGIGRSKGGLTTKTHAVVDALGNPIRIKLTAGNNHDIKPAPDMITGCYSENL